MSKAWIVLAGKKRNKNQGNGSIFQRSSRYQILKFITGKVKKIFAALHTGFTGVGCLRLPEAGGEVHIEVGKIAKDLMHVLARFLCNERHYSSLFKRIAAIPLQILSVFDCNPYASKLKPVIKREIF